MIVRRQRLEFRVASDARVAARAARKQDDRRYGAARRRAKPVDRRIFGMSAEDAKCLMLDQARRMEYRRRRLTCTSGLKSSRDRAARGGPAVRIRLPPPASL